METGPKSKKRRIGVIDPPMVQEILQLDSSDEDEYESDEVSHLLRASGFKTDIIEIFKNHKIQREYLSNISSALLTRMGITAVGEQLKILKWVCELPVSKEKVFNDPIHGHFELHPLLVCIIDTKQFQRLRYIKQLGGGYFVFPGASHNRFEHSLGVCYLAGEFVESLQRRQIELDITPTDILCVKIAGLCHDLGHGPFSHLYDRHFIPKVLGKGSWKHEQGSIDMLDHLINVNDLWPEFQKYGLSDTDLLFIKEMIFGPIQSVDATPSKWPYHGRSIDKSFLYEIVANKRNGIDVDKWDYFARDCHCLGIPHSFDSKRYMKFARVIEVEGIRQICCRDKEVVNLYEMFHTRNVLHRRAYQHKTSQAVEAMITEGLLAANDHFLLAGKNGNPLKMSEAIHDMYAYTNLTDSVMLTIMGSTDPRLKKAQELFDQIEERRLYKCIGQTQPCNTEDDKSLETDLNEEQIKKEIVESIPNCGLSVSDLHVQVVKFDYGMNEKNPIDEMGFYTKQKPNEVVKVQRHQVSQMLPVTFIERNIRTYSKKLDKHSLNTALKCFKAWCNKQDHFSPIGGLVFSEHEVVEGDFTPYGTPFGTPFKNNDQEDGPTTETKKESKAKKSIAF